MNRIELTKKFFSSIEGGDWDTLTDLLDDNFAFSAPGIPEIGKTTYITLHKNVQHAFPDWAFNIEDLQILEEDCVQLNVGITGTHSEDLHLPIPGLFSLPATHVKLSLPATAALVRFHDDQVLRVEVDKPFPAEAVNVFKSLG